MFRRAVPQAQFGPSPVHGGIPLAAGGNLPIRCIRLQIAVSLPRAVRQNSDGGVEPGRPDPRLLVPSPVRE
jgi:hypothetical protein